MFWYVAKEPVPIGDCIFIATKLNMQICYNLDLAKVNASKRLKGKMMLNILKLMVENYSKYLKDHMFWYTHEWANRVEPNQTAPRRVV